MLWIRRTCPTMAAALMVLSAVACSGGSDTQSGATTRAISNDQLPQMVLSLEQFGPELSGFTPDTENGFQTIDQVAKSEDDPAAERTDLQRFGWASAYQSMFANPNGDQSVGVLGAGSVAYLFATSDGLNGYWQDSLDEVNNPTSTEGSAALRKAERIKFEAGDEAIGFKIRDQFQRGDGSTANLTGWLLLFRHDRLMGSVFISAADVDDLEGQRLQGKAEALASTLNDRMAATLAAQPASAAPAAAGG